MAFWDVLPKKDKTENTDIEYSPLRKESFTTENSAAESAQTSKNFWNLRTSLLLVTPSSIFM